ncbi:transposase (plasmid) [Rhizobium leguminosarum]
MSGAIVCLKAPLLKTSLSRDDLIEAEWRGLKDFLPIETAKQDRGRRFKQNRFIVRRIGMPWHDVPPKYGNWKTIYRRLQHPFIIRISPPRARHPVEKRRQGTDVGAMHSEGRSADSRFIVLDN